MALIVYPLQFTKRKVDNIGYLKDTECNFAVVEMENWLYHNFKKGDGGFKSNNCLTQFSDKVIM